MQIRNEHEKLFHSLKVTRMAMRALQPIFHVTFPFIFLFHPFLLLFTIFFPFNPHFYVCTITYLFLFTTLYRTGTYRRNSRSGVEYC